MSGNLPALFDHYWYVAIVSAIVILLLFAFFVLPAIKLGHVLRQSAVALEAIRKRMSGPVIDLDEISREAMSFDRLAHPWAEYAGTLHAERRDDGLGRIAVVRWRSTALAEAFFSEQVLVDTPLKTEFFKHVPGILTGLGIIGTFFGLILGLSNFNVSNPEDAQSQLTALIHSVGNAFAVSASAITMAILFTFFEKLLVASRYREVEELRQLIDGLFDAGAGEEYLERLVAASETSATQAAQIKDALVADLRELLTELTERQVQAAARNSEQVSGNVGQAIADKLGGPIGDIAEAVRNVGANQGEAVNRMLTDVLTSFSAQMQDMFGGQMRGMGELLQQTTHAMRDTASRFEQLASNMDSAGKGAVEAMGERLNHAIVSMEARQQIMNRQMGEFVEQIRTSVAESQSKSGHKLQETLALVGEQVERVVSTLLRQAEESTERQVDSQMRYENASGKAIETVSTQMEKLVAQSAETNRALSDSVAKLAASTDSAIAGMNSGAETLYVAATDFAKAGQGVAATMRASEAAAGTISDASRILFSAAESAKEVIEEHTKTRDAFERMVADLKSTVENAKHEAALTGELVSTLKSASDRLVDAQREAEGYLKGVTEVMAKAHESFAENIERTLRESNRQFQKELDQAVSLLSGAVRELGEMLEEFTDNSRPVRE